MFYWKEDSREQRPHHSFCLFIKFLRRLCRKGEFKKNMNLPACKKKLITALLPMVFAMKCALRIYPKGFFGKDHGEEKDKKELPSFFEKKEPPLLFSRVYQLAFVTPMRRPWAASSRNLIRESPQKRYTEWLRPVTVHRFVTRTRELFRGNLLSCWRIL